MWTVIILLLAIDWLAFHDFSEMHTTRDWLTLVSSLLVFLYFILRASKKY